MKPDERGEGGELGEKLGFDAVPALIPGRWPDPATLQQDELAIIALIDGARPVSELLWMSGLSATVTQQVLWSLCERGIVTASRAAPRTDTGPGAASRTPVSFLESPEAMVARKGLTQDVAEVPTRLGRMGGYDVLARFAQDDGWSTLHLGRRGDARELQRLFLLKTAVQPRGPQAGPPDWGAMRGARPAEPAGAALLREAEIGGLLHHPNVLSVLDFGRYQERPFLVLDYVEGARLADLLLEGQPAAEPAALVAVLIDVLRALQAAHDLVDGEGRTLGLVHGAVSPAQILVGTDGAARLTGFGQSRLTAQPGQPSETATAAGRSGCLAPEQLRGEPLDARTDLFAVGAILWEALTGQPLPADAIQGPASAPPRKPGSPDRSAGLGWEPGSPDRSAGLGWEPGSPDRSDGSGWKPGSPNWSASLGCKPLPLPSSLGAPRGLDPICARALSPAREARYANADEMARALLEVALADGLLAGGREVASWVRRAAGELLAERKQRIRAATAEAAAPPRASAPRTRTTSDGLGPTIAGAPGTDPGDGPADARATRREGMAARTTAEAPQPAPLNRLPVVGVPYVAEPGGDETTDATTRRRYQRRVRLTAILAAATLLAAATALFIRYG